MSALLSIGEFSRLTHVSVKALRHYDDVGLLAPAEIDPDTGYRFYATAQVPTAQLIRRFRDLDMPLDDIRAVLAAPDVAGRDTALLIHLRRMEERLSATQDTVASLRALLEGHSIGPASAIERRRVGATTALAITERVRWDDAEAWLADAYAHINAVLESEGGGAVRAGSDGALYPPPFFEAHEGDVTAFVPIAAPVAVRGSIEPVQLPAADLAVALHVGSFADLDTTYGRLGTYVAEQFIGVDGPIRELYLDPTQTEVCWPVRNVSPQR
jgi:DNA-binding transcriptional MerR regulator/effector-binding domain-containing protein